MDQDDEAHAQVGLQLLRADTGLTVHDGSVPDNAQMPYVVIYTHIERMSGPANALDGASKTVTVRWYCHCVAENGIAARAVAMRVRAALLDQRPVIPGRSSDLIRQEQTLPPARDETTGRLVMDAVQVYRLTTTA